MQLFAWSATSATAPDGVDTNHVVDTNHETLHECFISQMCYLLYARHSYFEPADCRNAESVSSVAKWIFSTERSSDSWSAKYFTSASPRALSLQSSVCMISNIDCGDKY